MWINGKQQNVYSRTSWRRNWGCWCFIYLTTNTPFPSLLTPSREAVRNLVSSSNNMICLMEGCSARNRTRRLGHSHMMILPDSDAKIYLQNKYIERHICTCKLVGKNRQIIPAVRSNNCVSNNCAQCIVGQFVQQFAGKNIPNTDASTCYCYCYSGGLTKTIDFYNKKLSSTIEHSKT